jgi:lauroyl/myristoyl acyltransferase
MRAARQLTARALVALLRPVARRSVPAAFRLSDSVAAVSVALRRGPKARELARVFPTLPEAERRAAIRANWRTQLRNFLLQAIVLERGSIGALQPLIQEFDVDALQPPLILATFHTGPTLALAALAERLGTSVAAIRLSEMKVPRAPHVKVMQTGGSEEQRAAIFIDAVRHLRADGFALMAVDSEAYGTLKVPFLGRRIAFARGAFAMARMTGAPIVPIVARWEGDAIAWTVGPRLRGTDEEPLAAATAAWLESYVRARPSEYSQSFVDLAST